jgi:hypothetical protein
VWKLALSPGVFPTHFKSLDGRNPRSLSAGFHPRQSSPAESESSRCSSQARVARPRGLSCPLGTIVSKLRQHCIGSSKHNPRIQDRKPIGRSRNSGSGHIRQLPRRISCITKQPMPGAFRAPELGIRALVERVAILKMLMSLYS